MINSSSFNFCPKILENFSINFTYNAHLCKDIIVKWTNPLQGCYKLINDGSFKFTKAGCGGLIRDHNGQVIMAFAGPSVVSNDIMDELVAFKFVVQFCISLRIANL